MSCSDRKDDAGSATKSSFTVRLGKEAFYSMRDMDYFKTLYYLKEILMVNTFSEDVQEGIHAFLEKREPQWKGK